MDPKSLAKSKRSHTQHHKKSHHQQRHHPNQKPKFTTLTSETTNDSKQPSPPGMQPRPKLHQSNATASLPSNWDRYDEQLDSCPEDPSGDGKGPALSDVVLPKSRGADYRHLLSEAQSDPHSYGFSDPFASLNDVLPDFNQVVGSILSARGQSIMSWVGDDNFIVNDKVTTSNEAPFLSLNLHALAEQLAKVNLSERLFIEQDLLPSELDTGSLEASSGLESDTGETACSFEKARGIVEITFHEYPEKGKTMDQNSESKSLNLMEDDLGKYGPAGQSRRPESEEHFRLCSVLDTEKKAPSSFVPSTAEAELDMLLNSFDETKFLDSPGIVKLNKTTSATKQILGPPQQTFMPGLDPTKPPPGTVNSGSAIDDILEGTSDLMKWKGAPRQEEVAAADDVSTSLPATADLKSNLLDDFDSWLDTI